MSGHSKWNNIKRKKEKTDGARAKVFTKIGREIAVAVKEGGGNPASNSKLAALIAKAKANSVPNDNIQRIIKRAEGGDKTEYEAITYEGYGPGGIAVMVETLTDNRNRTAADVRHVFSKSGGNMGETGCVNWMFKRKGVFTIDGEENESLTEDDLMMIALDAGAEDVKSEEGGFEIITQPEDFDAVEKALADNNVEVAMAEITMIPDTMAELDEEGVAKVQKMLDLLDDLDDVQDVYTNADLPDDDEE